MIYPSKLCEIFICCIKTHLEQILGAHVKNLMKTNFFSHARVPTCVESHFEHNAMFRCQKHDEMEA